MSNPLQKKDQEALDESQDEKAQTEPSMTEWKQPYSTTEEPPTSTPANPPQPTGDQRTDPNKFPDPNEVEYDPDNPDGEGS